MLKSHRNLLEPRPSDRLRIGDRVVDIPLREIAPVEGGEAMRVTLKSLGVLLVLVAHAGRPVSREALLEWVWPDTLPTDDVLTQAITQLRRALGDDRERPRYIETLAKQGYRLIAPVAWIVEAGGDAAIATVATHAVPATSAPVGASAPVAPVASVGRLRRWLPAFALVALALAAFGYWRWHVAASATAPPATATPPRPVPLQRIANSPLSEMVPSLSPDGALIVYSRSAEKGNGVSLMVQPVSAVPPRALTEVVDGQWDERPAWSPDGREIAFLRVVDDSVCRVMVIPATGGAAREIGPCLEEFHAIAWYPDGRALISGGRLPGAERGKDGSALYRMDIDTGQWRAIAYERSEHDIDLMPKVSPDGRWIAFQRNLSLGDLWRIPVEGGKPERLTTLRTNFHGLAWTPDSRGLVFAYLNGSRVGLRSLDLASGAVADYDADDTRLIFPSIASSGDRVAFAVEVGRTQLRELALADGADAHARSQALFPSSRSDLLPSLAPDRRQLLFVSDRDGQERLWWGERGRPDSLRPLQGLVPMPRLPTVWHADSTRALTIGELSGGRKRVYEIEPERGRVRMLETPDEVPVHAAYHTDPDRILIVAEREQGRLGMTLYDRSVRPWRALGHVEDVILALTDPYERRIVFVRTFKPGLWQVDLDLRGMKQIDTVAYPSRMRSLMLGTDGVWVVDGDKACEWRLRRVKGTHAPESHCLGEGPYTSVGFGLDEAGRRWITTTSNDSGSDIGVVPLSAFLPVPPDAPTR